MVWGMDAELLATIYEAAVIPERWPGCLEALAAAVGAYAGGIVTMGPGKRIRASTSAGYRAPYDVLQQIPYDNSRVERFLSRRHFGFETDLDLCTQRELDDDPLYQVALYPFGIGWTVGTAIPMPTGDIVVFDLCHLRADGPFGAEAVESLDMYRPHLARAALLAARIGLDQAFAVANILEAVGLPSAFVNLRGQVIAANPSFEVQSSVRIGARNQLSIAARAADLLLHDALAGIRTDEEGRVRSIPVPAMEGNGPCVIHVLPLRKDARDLFVAADAVVIVTPVSVPAVPMVELISGLFDLTAAEVRLARSLTAGHDLRSVASASGRSVETVRTQLKSLMAKTGTRRQADLIRLLDSASGLPTARGS